MTSNNGKCMYTKKLPGLSINSDHTVVSYIEGKINFEWEKMRNLIDARFEYVQIYF